jgi:hypothetical protein
MSKRIPDIRLCTNDLHSLTDILHPYALYVQQIFSSGYTGMSVVEVNNLRRRFLSLFRSSDEPPILLTPREFEVINQAFDLFLRTIPKACPSRRREREATFRACEPLCRGYSENRYIVRERKRSKQTAIRCRVHLLFVNSA